MIAVGTEIEAHRDATVDETTIGARHVQESCLTTAAAEEAVVVEDVVSVTVLEVPAVEAVEGTEIAQNGSGARHHLPRRRNPHPT